MANIPFAVPNEELCLGGGSHDLSSPLAGGTLLSLNKDVRSKRAHFSDDTLLQLRTYVEGVGAALPDREVSVSLLDTPGTNEAGEAELRHQVCLLALYFSPFADGLQGLGLSFISVV